MAQHNSCSEEKFLCAYEPSSPFPIHASPYTSYARDLSLVTLNGLIEELSSLLIEFQICTAIGLFSFFGQMVSVMNLLLHMICLWWMHSWCCAHSHAHWMYVTMKYIISCNYQVVSD